MSMLWLNTSILHQGCINKNKQSKGFRSGHAHSHRKVECYIIDGFNYDNHNEIKTK